MFNKRRMFLKSKKEIQRDTYNNISALMDVLSIFSASAPRCDWCQFHVASKDLTKIKCEHDDAQYVCPECLAEYKAFEIKLKKKWDIIQIH